ncbi:hypothetical protein [Salipiger abyssi]|uniref:hypothetical protein n=1 Tax=Salipiger abyssi TaxID=1250539 RepID=UPI001F350CB6|nr:hypothetical protein [Salipiger abyssi]
MFLADKASDDGSGIWCSKWTIQRHTELGESTVKRTIREFLKGGVLVDTGARGCKNGVTAEALDMLGFNAPQVSPNHFDVLAARFDLPADRLERMRAVNILCDSDGQGEEFFQLYSQPFAGQLFFEIIESGAGYSG